MKIQIKTDLLQKGLVTLNHAVSSKSQLPILSNILIEATKDEVFLSSTDLEIGITTTIPAEVTVEGSITAPAKTLNELVSSFNTEITTLEAEETNLTVTTKNSKSTFMTQPAVDFPKLYLEKGEKVATVEDGVFQKDIEPVLFSASLDMSRPALTGVLLKPEDDGILFVATDGYRLSFKKSKTKIGELDQSLIIPARVLREVVGLKESGKKLSLFVSKDNNQIIFDYGKTLLVGRLIDGEFPAFEKIIPTDSSTLTSFDRDSLLRAVKMCSIFARESANIIKLSLKKDSLVVSSQTPSLGDNTVTVDAKLTGEENEIAFNARYLLDVLTHIPQDEITFEMTGPLNPGVFKLKGDDSFLHLIMPIRIQG